MDVLQKIKAVVTDPKGFFSAARSEQGYSDAMKYYAAILLVPLAVELVIQNMGGTIAEVGVFETLSSVVNVYIVSMLLTFVFAGLIHGVAKLISGVNDFNKTYRVVAYGMTPSVLLGWVPIAGILASLYSFYVMVQGMKVTHGMTTLKSAVSVVLVPTIVAVAAVAIGLTLIPYMNW